MVGGTGGGGGGGGGGLVGGAYPVCGWLSGCFEEEEKQ